MSYIKLTGKKTKQGQFIDVQRGDADNTIDIFLTEGRVHIDDVDTDMLRRRLFELMDK